MRGGADFPQIMPADMDSAPAAPWQEKTRTPPPLTPEYFGEETQGWGVQHSPALLRALPMGTGHQNCWGCRGMEPPGAASGMPGSSQEPLPAAEWVLPLELARVQLGLPTSPRDRPKSSPGGDGATPTPVLLCWGGFMAW